MPFVFKRLALLLSIAAAFAADKETALPGRRRPPATRTTRPTPRSPSASSRTIPARKIKTAFGKLNPYNYGILPVLVVIQNDSDKTIRLDRTQGRVCRARAQPRGGHACPGCPLPPRTRPAQDDSRADRPGQDRQGEEESAGRLGDRRPRLRRADAPAGQTASGFFYFQTGLADRVHGLSERI